MGATTTGESLTRSRIVIVSKYFPRNYVLPTKVKTRATYSGDRTHSEGTNVFILQTQPFPVAIPATTKESNTSAEFYLMIQVY